MKPTWTVSSKSSTSDSEKTFLRVLASLSSFLFIFSPSIVLSSLIVLLKDDSTSWKSSSDELSSLYEVVFLQSRYGLLAASLNYCLARRNERHAYSDPNEPHGQLWQETWVCRSSWPPNLNITLTTKTWSAWSNTSDSTPLNGFTTCVVRNHLAWVGRNLYLTIPSNLLDSTPLYLVAIAILLLHLAFLIWARTVWCGLLRPAVQVSSLVMSYCNFTLFCLISVTP